jgi:hypothetical protein
VLDFAQAHSGQVIWQSHALATVEATEKGSAEDMDTSIGFRTQVTLNLLVITGVLLLTMIPPKKNSFKDRRKYWKSS